MTIEYEGAINLDLLFDLGESKLNNEMQLNIPWGVELVQLFLLKKRIKKHYDVPFYASCLDF